MKEKKTVDSIVNDHPTWSRELKLLREIIVSTELVETVKWGIPTYTIMNKNVVGLAGFKNHYALWFFNGVFLSDNKKLLVNAQEGKTKGMRHLRFNGKDPIDKKLVKNYLLEAIENQKLGKEVKPERKSVLMPKILKIALSQESELKTAFTNLSKSKQKDYIEYINSAKKEDTQIRRLEKIMPMIISGIGLNDKYRKS